MGAPLVQCVDVHKKFFYPGDQKSGIHVLKGISVEFFDREIVSIVGASGAGKSTLLHVLGGLDRPTEIELDKPMGKVFWRDTDIFQLSDRELPQLRAKFVGFVFQFHHLLPEFTAVENVAIPSMILKESREKALVRAAELLRKLGLENRIHHTPGELSGGELQRVAVARALINNPEIIFADEPSGNLDSVNAQQLYELIVDLNRTEGKTFVIVTHNENFTACSHRILRMVDGTLQRV
jgi:lipoprotein-releasing system ATP-binding protein